VRWLIGAQVRSGTRALLALGTVGLGIAATLITLALSAGATRELEAASRSVGRNLLMVAPAQVLAPVTRGGEWYVSRRLERDDVDRIASEVRHVARLAPVLESELRVELGREDTVTGVRGVTPAFVDLRHLEVESGRMLDDRDERERGRVAVVGRYVAVRLAGGEAIVGRTLLVAGVPFRVVGLLAERGMSADGQNEDDQVLIPLETARRRLLGAEWLTRILVQAESAEAMASVAAEARVVLRDRHHLAASDADDFRIAPVLRSSEVRERSVAFTRGMATLFAAVTLAVGGVGVLAVSFLNVRDRRREIGLRRAVGARRRDVARLFVAESSLLSAAGGLLGVGVGAAAAALLGAALDWRLAIDLRAVVVPLMLSLALGVVFGLAPALAAARVTPIEALRDG